MKRFYGLLFACLLLALPLTANAGPFYFGSGTINAAGSSPTEYNPGDGRTYYLDYDGSVTIDDFEPVINITDAELFCVSGVTLDRNKPDYLFYQFEDNERADFAKATWVADNWTTFITDNLSQDVKKGEAQKAIWAIMGVMNILGNDGWDLSLFNAASATHVTTNWLWAESVQGLSQDFLVPYEYQLPGGDLPEVPEPSTLILLGLGLTGIALYKKKR